MEVLGAGKVYLATNSYLLFGAGAGVIGNGGEHTGSPRVRAFLGFIYEPRIGDRDGDGIPDSVDQCPDQPEDKDDFEDQDGCPDPTTTTTACPTPRTSVRWSRGLGRLRAARPMKIATATASPTAATSAPTIRKTSISGRTTTAAPSSTTTATASPTTSTSARTARDQERPR